MAETKAELAAQRFKTTWASWRSVEIDTHTDHQFHPARKLPPDPFRAHDLHYVETVLGSRLFDETSTHASGAPVRHAGYCDARRNALVLFDQADTSRQAQITVSNEFMTESKSGFSMRPVPLKFHYVGIKPLGEALRDPGVKFIGEDRVLDRKCNAFLFPEVPWHSGNKPMVYRLDDSTSTPLAVDVFLDDPHYRDGLPLIRWRALSLSVVDGRPLAMSSEEKTFKDQVAEGREPASVLTHAIKQVRFDREYARSTFWPVEQNGAQVFDSLKRKHYVVGGAKAATQALTSKAGTAPERIRVADSDAGADAGGMVATCMGAVLLVVALLLWRRNRTRQRGADAR
jgi:hypothetical protein